MLAYTKKGTGPAVVFIHGFLSGSKGFNAILEELSTTNTVIAVDLPGIGESKVENDTYTIVNYAEEVEKVLQQENIKEATWVGHSMGGYIALAAADEKIANVNRLVLLFSNDLADSEQAIEKRDKQKETIKKDGVNAFVDSMIENFFPENTPQAPIEYMRGVAKEATVDGMVHQLSAMQTRKQRSNFIENAEIPVIIIEGTLDKIVPAIETDGPNVKRISVETGHFGMAENPVLVIDALRQGLANK